MTDEADSPAQKHADTLSGLRSPVRPSIPLSQRISPEPAPVSPGESAAPVPPAPMPEPAPDDPQQALVVLRRKTETLVEEYAQGEINRVQFNALYQRYNEQRAIIEKLQERNPGSDAWRQVVNNRGQTGFLRAQLEAQPVSYSIYAAQQRAALMTGGTVALEKLFPAETALMTIWSMPNLPRSGLGRKQLTGEYWLVMAVGRAAATLTVFSLEPSKTQAQLLRDLHLDFERANQMALERGWLAPERLVFPQRALFERDL